MAEINEVLYPQQFDTVQNFPSVTEVTEATGEDINRNRDAILVLERTLGRNPQIGRYTTDPRVATVGQRLDTIENGIAEGRFAYRNLNVYDVLKVTTDTAGLAQVDIGASGLPGSRIAPVYIRGPLFVKNSGLSNNEIHIEVPFISTSRDNIIRAASIEGEPLLHIIDTNANPLFSNRLALQIDGNVSITNGRLYADFAIEHNQLLGIDTMPRTGVSAIHVSRGDYHSHVRRRDPSSGAFLNEIDPNPTIDNKGLIDHMDLINIGTKSGQTGFVPVEGVAYHVTDGDEHSHTGGRGAQINHNTLSNIDPSLSNHVTSGDDHTHSSRTGDGGALIDHNSLINIGFLSHADIDRAINVELRNHLELIDPTDASDIDPAKQGLGFHVPQGHISDPNAHHTRYTDQEALSAQVLISSVTGNYEEGQNTNIMAHIQAIGSGLVSSSNPHGVSATDIGALEGFDSQGNLPDFTRQFLENAVEDILNDPSFNVLRGNLDEVVTGRWTFNNTGGILIGDGNPTPSYATIDFNRAVRFDDLIAHIDNTGTPPYHAATGISNSPAGTISATNVQAALNELDGDIQTKEPLLSPSNQVSHTELANDAVEQNNIKDGEVVLTKLANPYSIVPFTFAITGTLGAITRRGIKIPAVGVGEVLEVSVSWRQTLGTSTSLDVDILVSNAGYGSATTVIGGPVDIVSYTQDSPTDITLVGGPFVIGPSDYTQIFCDVGETGGGTFELTVVVYCKLEHIA